MPLPVLCPCTAKLRVADHLRGQQIQCPKCATVYAIAPNGAVSNGQPKAPPLPDPIQVLASSGFSEEERERLEQSLEKGERLLWAGKPCSTEPFIHAWVMTVVGLIGTAILSVGVFISSRTNLSWWIPAAIGGVALLLLILSLTLPFRTRARFNRIAYALTDKRALVWGKSFWGRVGFQEYVPADVAQFTRVDATFGKAEGVGNLVFAVEVDKKKREIKGIHGFVYVKRVVEVEKLLREHLIDPYMEKLYQ